MGYTLGQAAKACGKSKYVLQKALMNGRISGKKRDDSDQWDIDPAELHRVYPVAVSDNAKKNESVPQDTHVIQELESRLKAVMEERDRLQYEKNELLEDRNAWRDQAQSLKLLTAPKSDPYAAILERLESIEKGVVSSNPIPAAELPPKSFWRRLVG